jgi:NodT family efflux transporter outer membrane factor (OMF) lipoprotein
MSCNRFSRLFLVAALLWASGCAKVGPDFAKPESAVMAEWLETERYPQVSTKADHYKDWWRSFNDPVLDNLIQTAYRQNLPLRIAGVRVLDARAQLGVVVGQLYPQVQQAFGSLQKDRVSNANPSSVPGQTPTSFWVSQLGGTASWGIDFWGKFRLAVESADASLMAAVADYDNTLVSLTADVASSYIALRTLENRLQIARQNVDVQKKSLEIARARFEGGTTSRRDVEQAQTVPESTEATIPTFESQLRQTQNALCILMGMPPTDLKELLARFPDKVYLQSLVNFLQKKYSGKKLDLLIPVGPLAFHFLLDHGNTIFPRAPTVFFAALKGEVREAGPQSG